MARVVAPLLSFSGSGQIARTQVYASWKGLPYVRRYVEPANPQSTEQTKTRNAFKWLQYAWRIAPAIFVAPWTAAAASQQLTNRNLFGKKNIALLRDAVDLTGLVMSPGAKGGISSPITITPGAGTLTAAGAEPSPLPSGWSVVGLAVAAVLQQDPQADADYEIYAADDSATPWSAEISGLAAGTYVAGAWWIYQRSASLTDLAYSAADGAEYVVT